MNETALRNHLVGMLDFSHDLTGEGAVVPTGYLRIFSHMVDDYMRAHDVVQRILLVNGQFKQVWLAKINVEKCVSFVKEKREAYLKPQDSVSNGRNA